jgi:hypothetical protein
MSKNWFEYWQNRFECCPEQCCTKTLWDEKTDLETTISNIKMEEAPSTMRKHKLQTLSKTFDEFVTEYIDEHCIQNQEEDSFPENDTIEDEHHQSYRLIGMNNYLEIWDNIFQQVNTQEDYDFLWQQFDNYDTQVIDIMENCPESEKNSMLENINERFKQYIEEIIFESYKEDEIIRAMHNFNIDDESECTEPDENDEPESEYDLQETPTLGQYDNYGRNTDYESDTDEE